MYAVYPLPKIILRRAAVLLIGVLALPVMLFRRDRARFTAICIASGVKPAASRSGWRRRKRQAAILLTAMHVAGRFARNGYLIILPFGGIFCLNARPGWILSAPHPGFSYT